MNNSFGFVKKKNEKETENRLINSTEPHIMLCQMGHTDDILLKKPVLLKSQMVIVVITIIFYNIIVIVVSLEAENPHSMQGRGKLQDREVKIKSVSTLTTKVKQARYNDE